jgi:hypothetical protein
MPGRSDSSECYSRDTCLLLDSMKVYKLQLEVRISKHGILNFLVQSRPPPRAYNGQPDPSFAISKAIHINANKSSTTMSFKKASSLQKKSTVEPAAGHTVADSLPISSSDSGTAAMDLEKRDGEETVVATSEENPHPVKGFKWWLLLLAIYSTTFLYGLDNTIVADIQSAVLARFGDVEKLSWLGIGFPLGSIAVILPL